MEDISIQVEKDHWLAMHRGCILCSLQVQQGKAEMDKIQGPLELCILLATFRDLLHFIFFK